MKTKVAVVIPNWNGIKEIGACLDSLGAQSTAVHIIVVENGSVDGSYEFITSTYPKVEVLRQPHNLGFAGGVNAGIRQAMANGFKYVALFNNDAVAHKNWVKHLVATLEAHPEAGIATCKLLGADKSHIDSTGDTYTTWGLPFPRGRGETKLDAYDDQVDIFGASGGASIYRCKMLQQIGLFDEDFFAYYEDVDISFRAQWAGWKVRYVPKAEAYHGIGVTSGRVPGFTTYQTFKNYPLLFWKNVPPSMKWGMFVRFKLAYASIYFSSLVHGRGWPATKGVFAMLRLFPRKLQERKRIMATRKVSDAYISSILIHDLPPNAAQLRRLRGWLSLGRHQG